MEQIPERTYRRILKYMPRPCVELIVHNGQNILALKRNIEPLRGAWVLPGGGVRIWEPLTEAVRRVGREELGVEVEIEKLTGAYEFFHEGLRHDIIIEYLVSIEAGEMNLDYQHNEYRWVNNAEIFYEARARRAVTDSGLLKGGDRR